MDPGIWKVSFLLSADQDVRNDCAMILTLQEGLTYYPFLVSSFFKLEIENPINWPGSIIRANVRR